MHLSTALATAAFISLVESFPFIGSPDMLASPELFARVKDKHEGNSGFFPNTEFNAQDQYVDVSPGSGHEWQAPGPTDVRGPCPGLNAAANHGFISRTGIITLEDTTTGLAQAYQLGLDFSYPLFVFSVLNSGSILDMEWSIGGPMPTTDLGGLIGKGLGISNSHNKYEGDSSVGRGDAYLHDGNAHSLNIDNYGSLYKTATPEGTFTTAILRDHAFASHQYSLMNNPYFFSGPIFFVPPIAHTFVVAFMSNHSATDIQGVLTKEVLNSFFSVRENKDGSLTWIPGHERIPDNWYRRPSSNPYGVAASFGDFGLTLAQFPSMAEVGGNDGKPNTFTGVSITDLTGGAFNAQTLLQGNNLACFAFQGTLAVLPGASQAILNSAAPFYKFARSVLGPLFDKLDCPQLNKFDQGLFSKYPGYGFKEPLQPDQPFKA